MTLSAAPLLLLAGMAAAGLLFPELRRAPAAPASGFPVLAPLPGTPLALSRPDEWAPHRARLARGWEELLGPLPERPRVEPESLSREELPDHTRIRLRYPAEAGAVTEAYLLLPKGFRGKRPGIVVLHQTTANHMAEPVGLAGKESNHLALHLVRRGYVCIAPRNFLWSDPDRSYQEITAEVLRRWKTGMAKMTWDALRATDLLAARPEVDPERLGSIGFSLGAKEALYHAAFDPRVRAAVSCEGGIGLSFSNWDADWYLGKRVRGPGSARDHHELLALVAPRAFLLVGGESADGAKSWPYIEANLPVWRLWQAEERLGFLSRGHGHAFPGPGPDRELVYRWLDHWLGG